MLRPLRRLFRGTTPDLVQFARGPDRQGFLRQLLRSDIFLFAALETDGVNGATGTEKQLLAEVERAASSLSDSDKGLAPFIYERDGRRALPFFSTEGHAQSFVADFCRKHNRSQAFQMIGVRGEVLLQLLPACDELVLNDQTADEVVIPKASAD